MLKRLILMLLIISMLLTLTGCWDQIEIEERTFISSLGVDIAPEEVRNKSNRYEISYSFPNYGGGVGGETEITNIFLSVVANDMFNAERILATRSSKNIFLGHMKLVILGEEAAEDPMLLRETLDALERNPLISRKVSLGIAEGSARSILETEPKMEGNVGVFLVDTFRRRDRTQRAPTIDLGEALISLHQNGTALLPKVVAGKDEIKLDGSAVCRDYQLVGWLDGIETSDVMMAKGDIQFLLIEIPHMDMMIPYNVTDGKSKYELVQSNNELTIKIDVELEGDIQHLYLEAEEDIMDPEYLKTLQEHSNKLLEESMLKTFEKLQKEYNADVLQFGAFIERYHPKVWREIKNDWPEVYKNLTFDINVDSKIRRIGLAK